MGFPRHFFYLYFLTFHLHHRYQKEEALSPLFALLVIWVLPWIVYIRKMTHHINNVCKSASHAIRNIGRIRKYFGKEECEKLFHAFVTSQLDCCNSMVIEIEDITQLDWHNRWPRNNAQIIINHMKICYLVKKLIWLCLYKYKTPVPFKDFEGLEPIGEVHFHVCQCHVHNDDQSLHIFGPPEALPHYKLCTALS